MEAFLELLQESLPVLLKGAGLTLRLTIVTLPFAVLLGLVACILGMTNIRDLKFVSWLLRSISNVYIAVIRGTPILVQVFFIYFGVTQFLDIRMTAYTAGVISLSLNAGAYLSEIFRGGIQAVNKGQMEAARSLGLPYGNSMVKIILPQALRIVIPSIVNQFIITLKDTSIISVIGLMELTMQGKQIIARTYKSFYIWIMVGVIYFIMNYVLSKISQYIERRLSIDKGRN
ncbi:MAG: amino acid ABC transporter permease [Clostridiales bacterium]|nr:amino acid ABC transporter permease [Clostridiales bacterium]MCD8158530.1 amino acid ABC transporter permease [Clostridiales bacterium]